MEVFALTVEQIKEIFEAGANRESEVFPYEKLLLILQEHMNEGVSVHSKEYLHMSDVIEIMKL